MLERIDLFTLIARGPERRKVDNLSGIKADDDNVHAML